MIGLWLIKINKMKKIVLFTLLVISTFANAQRHEEEKKYDVRGSGESPNVNKYRGPYNDSAFKIPFNTYEQKNYPKAYEEYTTYLKKYPTDFLALYNRALCSYNLKDYKTAIRDFTECIFLKKKDVNTYYMRGLSNFNLKEYKLAEKDFDTTLTYNKNFHKAYCYKGACLNEDKKYSEGLKLLDIAASITSTFEPTFFYRNVSRYYTGDYEGGLSDCEKAIALQKSYLTTFWKGSHLIELKRHKEAAIIFDTVIAHEPKNAKAYFNRSLCHYDNGDYKTGLKDVTSAIELSPSSPSYYYQRGLCNFFLGNYETTVTDCNSALTLGYKDARAYCFRGASHYYLSKDDLAYEDLNKAIELKPSYESSYYYRAKLNFANAKYDAGIADCDQALKLIKTVDSYRIKGNCLTELKKYDEAIQNYNLGLEIKKDSYLTTLDRGITYYYQEKDDLARKDFDKAISLNKTQGEPYYFRGKLKKIANDNAGACSDLKQAQTLGFKKASDELVKLGCK